MVYSKLLKKENKRRRIRKNGLVKREKKRNEKEILIKFYWSEREKKAVKKREIKVKLNSKVNSYIRKHKRNENNG